MAENDNKYITVAEATTLVENATEISEAAGNAIEMKNDGFYAAIYYEDLDTE